MPSFKRPRLAHTSYNSDNASPTVNANGMNAAASTGANAIAIANKLADVFGHDSFDGTPGSFDGVGSDPSSLPERDLVSGGALCLLFFARALISIY